MMFTAAITREDGWFVARCLEVEVASQGKSVEEAQANLQEALSPSRVVDDLHVYLWAVLGSNQ